MRIPVRFEFFANHDWDTVEAKATEMGWQENKVVVKRFHDMKGGFYWTIEPFEEECQCPNVVAYENRSREASYGLKESV